MDKIILSVERSSRRDRVNREVGWERYEPTPLCIEVGPLQVDSLLVFEVNTILELFDEGERTFDDKRVRNSKLVITGM